MFVDTNWRLGGEPHEPPKVKKRLDSIRVLVLAVPLSATAWCTAMGWYVSSANSEIFFGLAKLCFSAALSAVAWLWWTNGQKQ
jgi:hypothetical protein